MQKLLFVLLFLSPGLYLNAQTLTGHVTDSTSGKPVVGASIYIPQLKKGAVTDATGAFAIPRIPNGNYEVDLQMIGYSTITEQVTVNGITHLDFTIAVSPITLNEVVVTSLGNRMTLQRAPQPVNVVTHEMFLQESATNVIDALAKQPGLDQVTTGPGVSKPEINGLGYNRVLTLFDGERQEDFQWGDEHGILIDPYAVYNAEVIRGPASLQYGANAEAGVISFSSQPLSAVKTFQGSVQSEFQTNTGLTGNSLDFNGNTGHGLRWDVRGSFEEAHDYWDPHDGYVWGTAFRQDNERATVQLDRNWGYSKVSISRLYRQIEIPDGNRDSATGAFEFDVPLGAQYTSGGAYVPGTGKVFPTLSNFLSYNPNISGYQILGHIEAWWQNMIYVGKGKILADIGYTESIRHEIDTGVVGEENMVVHDVPYSIKYQLEKWNGFKFTAGVNGIYEFENNYPEPPSPYVGDYEVPNYHLFDLGGYGIVSKDWKKLTLSAGLRYDMRSITGDPMYLLNYATYIQTVVPEGTQGAYQQFPAFNNTYTGYSGSLGASYQLPAGFYVKGNVGKSYRAPAINELTANELDPSNEFKQGNPNLKAEQGVEADVAFGDYGKDIGFEVDAFYNYINNFITADRIQSAAGGDSIELGAPVYKYLANSAIVEGITAYLHVHPQSLPWFQWDNGFTYIYTFMPGATDSTDHVEFTPAPRLTSSVRVTLPKAHGSSFANTYLQIGLEHDWPQNNIYSALWNELPSLAYTLLDASVGTNIVNPQTKRVLFSVYVSGTNLANISYIDHTSRPQYFWAYNGYENPTNFGAAAAIVTNRNQGIFNMGRNISFKVLIPFGGHEISETEMQGMKQY